jgi:hypothetical protein
MKMKLLPYDSFDIETSMTLGEAVEKLNSVVGPWTWSLLFKRSSAAPLIGNVTSERFKVFGNDYYRNFFLPIIRGRFRQGQAGIVISVKMSPHPFVMVFMGVLFGGVILANIMLITVLLSGKTPFEISMLIVPGLLVGGWAMVSFGFWAEANKARAILTETFGRIT